jgi:hypothetical protein
MQIETAILDQTMPAEKPGTMKDFYAVFTGLAFLLPLGLSAGLTIHLWR